MIAIVLGAAGIGFSTAQVHVLVDQVGYERGASKPGIIAGTAQDLPKSLALVDAETGQAVVHGELEPAGEVFAWAGRVFWTADFSTWKKSGRYILRVANNPAYMFFRSYRYTSAPGAIVNGITAGLDSEDGIAFNQGFASTGKDDDWRWTEEWLPHAAWYLYAISLPH